MGLSRTALFAALLVVSVAWTMANIRKTKEGAETFGGDSIDASTLPLPDDATMLDPEWAFHQQGPGKIIDKSAGAKKEEEHPEHHMKVLDDLFKETDDSEHHDEKGHPDHKRKHLHFGHQRNVAWNDEEFDDYEALSHVPHAAVGHLALMDGSQNATYYQFMDAEWLNQNAVFKGRRAHYLSNSQAQDIARQEKVHQQTGRLDFGVGGTTNTKLFEVPITDENQLEESMDYVVRIEVMAEDLTADNDLSIGLSNGEDVLVFERNDAHNRMCGGLYHGRDNGDRVDNWQRGPKTGRSSYTHQHFGLKITLDHQGYATMLADCGATVKPAIWSPPKKFIKSRPIKVVAVANDRGEKYGIYGIQVSIHREGTFNRLMTGEWLFHHATQPIQQKRQGFKWKLKKERLVLGEADSAKQKVLEVPLVPSGAMLDTLDYHVKVKVYSEDLTPDNDLTVGLTDGISTIAFQRVDRSSDYGGVLMSCEDGDALTTGLTLLSKCLLMERVTQRVFEMDVRLSHNMTYAAAGSSISFVSASFMTDKPLDKTRGLSLVLYRDDGAEQYAIHAIDFEANVGTLNQLITAEYIWGHGRVSSRRATEIVNAGKRDGRLDSLPPAAGLLFKKGGDTDYEVLFEEVVVPPNTMTQSQTYTAVLRGYVGTGDHGLVIGLTDGHNIAGIEMASAAQDTTGHNLVTHRPFWDKYNYYDLENAPESGESFGPPNSGRRHERGYFEIHIGFGGQTTRVYTSCDSKVPSSGWVAKERLRPEEGLRLIVVSQQPKYDQTFYETTVMIQKEGNRGGVDCPRHCSGNGYCAFHKLCIQKHPDRGPIYEHCPLTPEQPKPRVYEPICSCDPNWTGNDCSLEKDTPTELYSDLRGCKMTTGVMHIDEFKPHGVVSADMKEAVQKFGLVMAKHNSSSHDDSGAAAVADAAITDAAQTASAELDEIFSGRDPADASPSDLGTPAADYEETDPTFNFAGSGSGGNNDDVDFGEVESDDQSEGGQTPSVEDNSDQDAEDEYEEEFQSVFKNDADADSDAAPHSANIVHGSHLDDFDASGELAPVGSVSADDFAEEINKLGAELKHGQSS